MAVRHGAGKLGDRINSVGSLILTIPDVEMGNLVRRVHFHIHGNDNTEETRLRGNDKDEIGFGHGGSVSTTAPWIPANGMRE